MITVNVTLDEETNSAYVKVSEKDIIKTILLDHGILVDLDKMGSVVGVELGRI
jgi:uncharacterized protein YuzE